MCVLKHSKILRLPVRKECFNTNWFFLPHKGFHPSRRPFAPCFKCGARTSFPVCSHFAVYNCPWAISRFLTDWLYTLARSIFAKIILRKSSLDSVCCLVNSISRCFFLSFSIIVPCGKQKTPGFLILGSLEFKCKLLLTIWSPGPSKSLVCDHMINFHN